MKEKNKKLSVSIGKQYFLSTVILFGFIAVLYFIQDIIGYQTVSLMLLLIIFLLPLFNFDKGPIIVSAVISALAWDYYFIPPHFTLHIAKAEDVMMLFLFFIVAVTNGVLTARLKVQKNEMLIKEKQSEALYNLLKSFSTGKDLNDILKILVSHIYKVFGFESVIFFSEDGNKLKREPHPSSSFLPDEIEWLAAEASFKGKIETGKTINEVYGTEAIYIPLINSNFILCVIGIKIGEKLKAGSPDLKFLKEYVQESAPYLVKYLSYSMP